MTIASPGATMAVDWEQRIDFTRLRRERLQRAQSALDASELGALLLFDPNNIRYVTSTHIGEWARDKNARYVFLPRGGDPILWDFGSAAKSHQLYAPWLPTSSWRAGVTPMRGALPRETGVPDMLGACILAELRARNLQDAPLGIDMTDMVTLEALQRAGIRTTDAQPVMLKARRIKTADEITVVTPNETLTLARKDIRDLRQSKLSMMPEGLLDQLKDQEVRDLLYYLSRPGQVPLPTATAK